MPKVSTTEKLRFQKLVNDRKPAYKKVKKLITQNNFLRTCTDSSHILTELRIPKLSSITEMKSKMQKCPFKSARL